MFLGITGDFNRRRLSWWTETPVPRFCVFTDWSKVDMHCFPRALNCWNNATAGKLSTFPLALLLHHFDLLMFVFPIRVSCNGFLSVKFLFFDQPGLMCTCLQKLNLHVKMKNTVLVIGSTESFTMKLAWACSALHVPFGHPLAFLTEIHVTFA